MSKLGDSLLKIALANPDVIVPKQDAPSHARIGTVVSSGSSEHDEQAALIAARPGLCERFPEAELLFAIPNGGHRNLATAGRLRAEGVRAGVPDLFLPVARGIYHGLFIEMKFGRGKLSRVQRDMMQRLRMQGYLCLVCWSAQEALERMEEYFGI